MKELKYLTIDEQLDLLKSKGLKINSEKVARKYLNEIGYYKLINGYKTPFKYTKNENGQETIKKFIENTTIDELYHLYTFDQNLKSLLLKYISQIEIMVKARMSDLISSKYGIKESEYLVADNFAPDKRSRDSKEKKFLEIQVDILNTIREQSSKHKSIKWYADNYGFFPFWIVCNVLSFGTISLLYSKMKQPDQYLISKTFGQKSKTFESMLIIIQLFRNVCAHNEVVYNFRTFKSLSQKDIEHIYKMFKIEKDEKSGKYKYGVNDIFSLIIIFKLILPKNDFLEFLSKFNSLLSTLKKKVDKTMFDGVMMGMGIVRDLNLLKK